MYETGVIFGRFQVLHNDHMKYLLAGKERCRHLVVGITNPSPDLMADDQTDPLRSLPEANPLTYWERFQLVRDCLLEAQLTPADFSVVPFPINIPELFQYYVPMDGTFFLTIYDDWGRKKHEALTAKGLKVEVLWERPAEEKGISAKKVRSQMARGESWEDLVPPASARLLSTWDVPSRMATLLA